MKFRKILHNLHEMSRNNLKTLQNYEIKVSRNFVTTLLWIRLVRSFRIRTLKVKRFGSERIRIRNIAQRAVQRKCRIVDLNVGESLDKVAVPGEVGRVQVHLVQGVPLLVHPAATCISSTGTQVERHPQTMLERRLQVGIK